MFRRGHSTNSSEKVFSVLLYCLALAALPTFVKAQEPLVADAGRDSVLCEVNIVDHEIKIGGFPAAHGGSGTYTYSWDIFPKPYVPFSSWPEYKVWASDMLSDTTTHNPLLLPSLPMNRDGPIAFILTVSDDSGNVAVDSVTFYWVSWITALGNAIVHTFPGDTQEIYPTPFGGGFPPYHFHWGDNPDLIGPNFDSSMYGVPVRQIIVPDNISENIKWYGVTVTDSLGCTFLNGVFQGFKIEALGIDETDAILSNLRLQPNDFLLYPNPTKNLVTASFSIKNAVAASRAVIKITDLTGRVVIEEGLKNLTGSIDIDISNVPAGAYVVSLEVSGMPAQTETLNVVK